MVSSDRSSIPISVQEKREDVCDVSLFNETQNNGDLQQVQVKIRRRRDLKGHLTKVSMNPSCLEFDNFGMYEDSETTFFSLS